MKKIFFGLAAAGLSLSAVAAGYVGLDVTRGSVSDGCQAGEQCQQRRTGFDLKFGSKLPESLSFKMDAFRVDTIEVGVTKVGSVVDRRTKTVTYTNPDTTSSILTLTADVPVETRLSADALLASVVAHYDLGADFSLVGKVGLAYVTGTLATKQNGVTMGPKTENHVSPLFGLGVEYKVVDNVKLNLGFHTFKVKTDGVNGRAKQVTLGGQYDF